MRSGFCGQINDPPSAGNDLLERLTGRSAKILITSLVSNDKDAEGDPFELTKITGLSEQGVAVSLISPWIAYEAPPTMNSTDKIEYWLQDTYGNVAKGILLIAVSDGKNITRNILQTTLLDNPARLRIQFMGIPNLNYRIQATTHISNPVWETLTTLKSDGTGYYEYVDTDTASFPTRYYRAISP